MSDHEQEDQGQMSELAKVLSRYKSTKGDADKRKETSKLNMAKARAAKLEKLKQEKEEKAQQYEYDDDSEDNSDDSDDSEQEELVLRPKQGKQKKQQGTGGTGSGRMDMLEKAILMLAENAQKKKAKPKKKPARKTTVIQVTPTVPQQPTPQPTLSKKAEMLMNDVLTF